MILFNQIQPSFLYQADQAAGTGFLDFYLTESEVTKTPLDFNQVWNDDDQKGYLLFYSQAL